MKYLILVFSLVLCADAKANSMGTVAYAPMASAGSTSYHQPTRQARKAARKAAKGSHGSTSYASHGTVAYVAAPVAVVPVVRTPILPRRRYVAAAPVYVPVCVDGSCIEE